MKSIKLFSLAVCCIAFTYGAAAQATTESFKVSGNCGMCKTKIEKAAKDAGATEANWDQESKMLTVTYSSSTTNTAKIQKKVAGVGYDNAGFKASLESYKKLHGCCQYDREDNAAKTSCCSEKCSDKCEMKDGKCTDMAACKEKGCCGGHEGKMDCCKDGKCTKAGHDGKDCCKGHEGKMDCCKDGKCSMPGHSGKDCCKKS
ncbi:MAG: hypothetical protein JNM88_11730 [Chitinophagaceae bacterium]|nr:hypothetical protein [Chitinophagaceae bacterium]